MLEKIPVSHSRVNIDGKVWELSNKKQVANSPPVVNVWLMGCQWPKCQGNESWLCCDLQESTQSSTSHSCLDTLSPIQNVWYFCRWSFPMYFLGRFHFSLWLKVLMSGKVKYIYMCNLFSRWLQSCLKVGSQTPAAHDRNIIHITGLLWCHCSVIQTQKMGLGRCYKHRWQADCRKMECDIFFLSLNKVSLIQW